MLLWNNNHGMGLSWMNLGPVRCNGLGSGDKPQQAVPGNGAREPCSVAMGIPGIHEETRTAVKRGRHGTSSAFSCKSLLHGR